MIVFCCDGNTATTSRHQRRQMCGGFETVSSRSRVRHSTAEPLRLHERTVAQLNVVASVCSYFAIHLSCLDAIICEINTIGFDSVYACRVYDDLLASGATAH